jgi:U3 small nucleolar RNA-associated protein 10
MPIFTFMGANTLRQDDEYSAHVIEQTVQRVIPTVVKSLQGQGTGLLASGAELVSTFVASYRHVPVHRRLKLFEALTEALGPTEFLFTVVAKLAGMYAVDEGDVEVGEFVSMLAGGFPAEAQLKSVVHYLSTVKDVLNPQPAGLASILFGLEENGRDVPMEEMARRLLSVLKSFLSSERLKAKIQKSLKSSKEAAVSLRSSFSEAMEQIMALGQQYATHKTISTEILDTMSRLLELLTIVEFVRVIEGLISRPDSSFQSLALTTFKNRVAAEYRTDTASRTAILALSPKIAHIVTASEAADELKADALLCIQAVIKIFGKQEPNTIFALSDILVGPGALHCVDNGLRVLALVCLTNMASVLGGRIVPVLPKTVPVAVEYLRMAINGEDNMSSLEIVLMHNAVFKYLEELVNILPSFMTSYLKNVLLLAGAAWEREDLDEDVQCDVRRGFLNVITAKIELKTVVAVSNKVWKATCETGEASAVRDLIEMVQKAISNATKSVVQRSHQPLLQFFISALDLRCGGLIMVEEDVDSLEDTVMAVCLEIVYKLNDSIFKPMFLRLVEWATEDVFLAGKNEGSEVEDGKWTRLGVVWKLLETLSENLKVSDYHSSSDSNLRINC